MCLTIYTVGKFIFDKIPVLRPILYKGQMYFRPKFSGAGMITIHNMPDTSESDHDFRVAMNDADRIFPKNINPYCQDKKALQAALWKFWYVFYAVRLAFKFTNLENPQLVECGVANG